MKNGLMLMITLLVIGAGVQNAQAQNNEMKTGDTLYVCAYNGLNLRADASTKSDVITKLDHADEVIVSQVMNHKMELDHRESYWVKVESEGYTGYLFGGYLTVVEPLVLTSFSFDCNTDLYYLDWVSEVIGDSQLSNHNDISTLQSRSGSSIETTTYNVYQSGDVFYNKVGPQTDTYYFETPSLGYNDVLNFMEYMVACQNRFCAAYGDSEEAIFRPIKNRYGQLVRVDCTTPLSMTAEQHGGKMVVKLETCM